ncbi:hypothetical protein [Paenibacillus elgii]|uniref:hypothetical protein n=1 Tax=Paenibacillus elgii TaxID=189691 RepID=UPI00203A551F|nr:hypothetical protein [Paenibacillus elgii]MCM3274358.1 hypothetical protein [Paenibacillus elgii]
MVFRKCLAVAAIGSLLLGGLAVNGVSAQDLSGKRNPSSIGTLGVSQTVHIPVGSTYQLEYGTGYQYYYSGSSAGQWSVSSTGFVRNYSAGHVNIDVYNQNGYLVAQYQIYTYGQ